MQYSDTEGPSSLPLRNKCSLAEELALFSDLLVADLELQRRLGSVLDETVISFHIYLRCIEGKGTNLVDVGLRASRSRHNVLDEPGHLSHDIHSVNAATERSLHDTFEGLAILGLAVPQETDAAGLRPVVL
jgi:hypothetical protein